MCWLQKAPLSSQAASHLSVGDGDGVHPWYMMLRRFSSRSARKWADLGAARGKRVVAVLSIGFGSKESGGSCGPWVAFRLRLESIASSTAAENWAMMSGGARYMSSSVTVLPKTMRPVKVEVAMKVDLLMLKMLRCPAVEQVASMKARWAFKPGAA